MSVRARVRLLSGKTLEGTLLRPFVPEEDTIRLRLDGGGERTITQASEHVMWVALREEGTPRPKGMHALDVITLDGERFEVEALALGVHPSGFFAWPRRPGPDAPTRWFFFRGGVRRVERPQKIGEILVSEGLASAEAVQEGLARQRAERKRLGEVLVEQGVVTRRQLEDALRAQKEMPTRKRLGEILLETSQVDEDRLIRALAAKFQLPIVDLSRPETVDPEAAYSVPEGLVRKHKWLPIAMSERELTVAVSDPVNNEAYDDFRFVSGKRLKLVLARPSEIHRAIAALFSGWDEADALVIESAPQEEDRYADVGEDVDAPPIVRLVNRILVQGLERGASDIHLRPLKDALALAYRVDGDLREETRFHGEIAPKIVSRLKVLARMDIAEHRLPQDGRLLVRWHGRPFELRVSLIPNIYGESLVMRILGREELVDMRRIGLREKDRERLIRLARKPHGMILVTGPTGSGKSTTLFALIKEVARRPVHVLTIEDPVEYRHAGVNQIEVQPRAGLTFARVLRNVLRHDPDVVLVGEIRDEETAEIALRASLTGHLLLSTLHTNSAADTVLRLADMGARPFLLAEALLAISSQNLLRRLCPACRRPVSAPEGAHKLLKALGLPVPARFWDAAGCDACAGSGIQGRVLLYELLIVNRRIRQAIHDGLAGRALEEVAIAEGMIPKAHYLVELLARGEVGWSEAMRFLV